MPNPSNLATQGRKSRKKTSKGQLDGFERGVNSASATILNHLNQCLSVRTVKDSVFPVRCKSQMLFIDAKVSRPSKNKVVKIDVLIQLALE